MKNMKDFFSKVYLGRIGNVELLNSIKEVTNNYEKVYIKALFQDIRDYYFEIEGYYIEKEQEYIRNARWFSEHEFPIPIPEETDICPFTDSLAEVLCKLAINNYRIKFIIKEVYGKIPMLPPINEPVEKRTPQQEKVFVLDMLKKINDWLNNPDISQYNESLLHKYNGINLDALLDAYDQYEALYNGEWVQLGNYPEEGLYNPNSKGREQALNILRGLYDKIKPYEQQIKIDMEYLEGNLMAFSHIKEKISCMANICRDYHDRIEFIENLNEESGQNVTSTQKTNQNKKGRPTKSIQECISKKEEIERVLKLLHTYIDGKTGSAICLPLLAVIKLGKMTTPTYTQIKKEFGDIITKSLYNAYMDEHKFNPRDLNGVMNEISQDLG